MKTATKPPANKAQKARVARIHTAQRNAAALDFARSHGCVIPQECYDRVWSHVDGAV